MCGIVGVLSERPVDPRIALAMRDQLVHRGPDAQGLWLDGDSQVCLGFRRLAIVDLSADANQPFVSRDGRYVMVFNGEIYNFRALRRELEDEGVEFRTQSDTEVLIECFRRWGGDCLVRLSGMFAFAIWDTVERRLFCARDRMGEKPFYYAQVGREFLFASEVKALLAWPRMSRRIHFPALVDFLSLGFVADPKSIWEDCRKLEPGHSMWVDFSGSDRPRPQTPTSYWDLQFEPDASVDDWGPRILDALQTATREMSYADVPVGAFLSGGVDSSAVVAALSRGGATVSTFTIGFEESAYDERPYAREVAQLYRTQHNERLVVPESVETAMGALVWQFDEPFNDYSYLPTFYVCKSAREAITVALSGDGGDEMFAGYGKYRRSALRDDVTRLLPRSARRMIDWAANGLPASSDLRRRVRHHTSDVVDEFTRAFTLGFPRGELIGAARGELSDCLQDYSSSEVIRPLLRRMPPDRVGTVNAMRYLDAKLTLAGDILVKVDRASMAVSLEVRPVFLHRDVVALAATIPPAALATRRETKRALKAAVRSWLPQSILSRPKMGFAMPLGNWISDLGSMTSRARSEHVMNDWLDPRLLGRLSARHAEGTNNTARIHSLSFLRQWSSLWLEQGAGQKVLAC
ncbi:MAG TPA: asparagine synthase (glutamine-hydrolyzing) [Vicinamibacterales bacterium]|nr:asparagine synthase (glutamine-hydrolyzing) [Vicinamibacterales bacterium]